MDDKDVEAAGWITEKLPGGTFVHYPLKPVSLPHTRRPLDHEMVIGWWMLISFVLLVAAIWLAVVMF